MNKLSPHLCPCYKWNGHPLVPNGIFKSLAEDDAIKGTLQMSRARESLENKDRNSKRA